MDRVVEGILGETGSRRVIMRKPAERDRSSKLNTTTTSEAPVPVQQIIRPMTERPSAVKTVRQRKHIQPLVTVLYKLLAKCFKSVRDRALEQKKAVKCRRLYTLFQDKRMDHITTFLDRARTRMLRFRRLTKLATRLSRQFKQSIKVRCQQAFCSMLRSAGAKTNKLCRTFQNHAIATLSRVIGRAYTNRGRLFMDQLKVSTLQYRKKVQQVPRIARGINQLVKLAKRKALLKLVGYAAPIETKKKLRVIRSSGPPSRALSTQSLVKPDNSKDILIAELRAQLQEKTKQMEQLDIQLKEHRANELSNSRPTVVKHQVQIGHSRSTTPQNIRVSSLSQQQSEFDGRDSKVSQNQKPNSQCGHDRSSKSIRSYFSDNRSVFSTNTMNLLKKLDEQVNPNACCKYRGKYQQQHRLAKHLKQKLQMLEEEYQMLADINRHFDETLQIQLNPTLASGEINQLEFDSLKKTNERLEKQLGKCRTELQQTRKDKQKQRVLFKSKLQTIYQKMSKPKFIV